MGTGYWVGLFGLRVNNNGRHSVGFRGSQFQKIWEIRRSAEKENKKNVRVWIRDIVEALGSK